jgi:Skp family chaperone for outer membrane proteins
LARGSEALGRAVTQATVYRRVAVLLLAGLIAVLAVARAEAQAIPKLEPVSLAVIDFRGVLAKSDAAKGVRKTIDARRAEYREKFAKIEKQLRDEQQALAQQRAIITAAAFEQRARELKARARAAQQQAQAGNQLLKRAFDKAMDGVQKKLFRVVAELAEEAGAGVVLFRSSIVIAVKKLEISQEALKRLNKQLPKIDVVFEPAKK